MWDLSYYQRYDIKNMLNPSLACFIVFPVHMVFQFTFAATPTQLLGCSVVRRSTRFAVSEVFVKK